MAVKFFEDTRYILQTIVPNSGFSLLRLGDGVDGRDAAVLVVDGSLAVLRQLLAARTPELAERAVVGRLPHGDGGAALVVLTWRDNGSSTEDENFHSIMFIT